MTTVPSGRDDRIDAAVAAWRAGLRAMSATQPWLDQMRARQRELGLEVKGRPVLNVAEPNFLTDTQLEADQAVATAILDALVAAGDAVTADASLRARYLGRWLEDQPGADLFDLPTGYQDPIVFGRLDGVRSADGLQVIEFNGGLPGGLGVGDLTPQVMADWPVYHSVQRSHPFRPLRPGPATIATLRAVWRDFGGTGDPFIVVALPEELTAVAGPTLAHLADLAAAADLELNIVDPGALHHHDGRLRLDGRPVDVLLRAFFTTMLTYLGPRLDGILAALRAGDVCMVTALRAGLYGHKGLFAAVTDPAVELDLDPAKLSLARGHLPWTRIVGTGASTGPDGERIDLPDYLAADRDRLVVKPVDGTQGVGVELGWTHDSDSWRAVIDKALSGGHIAQRRIPIPQEHYATLAAGFPVAEFTADHNPLLIGGRVAGYMVRMAPHGSGITNLSTGGSAAPTFLLEARAHHASEESP